MPSYLAKLDNCRGALGDSTDQDATLTVMLAAASSLAERLAGLQEGALRRRIDIVEYPASYLAQSRYMRLRCRPVESISRVVQLWSAGRPADFAAAEPLEEYTDYVIDSPLFGEVERINSAWTYGARMIQVTYTAGFLDPSASVSAWATATSYSAGALVRSADMVWCARSAHTSAADNAPPDETTWARVWEVPQDLQFGVSQQVIRMYQTWEHAGRQELTTVGGGATINLSETKPHPALVEAARKLQVPL